MMQINETIRKLRKELGLTQEQLARQLGVSAPAVNKWENSISFPDITLLPPLARLLKTDINTLLSFHEELTDNEIGQFIHMISEKLTTESFETIFQIVTKKINEYPNCDKLILWSAQLMNAQLIVKQPILSDKTAYERQIEAWFQKTAASDDPELAKQAQMSLAQKLIRSEKYDEAQKLLDKIPPLGLDKRIIQIQLFEKQERYEKAFQTLEQLLLQHSYNILSCLMQKITILCKQKNYDEALLYAEKIAQLSDILELNGLSAHAAYFTIYAECGNKEKTLDALEAILKIESFELENEARTKNTNTTNAKAKEALFQIVTTDPAIDFIRDEPRFKKLEKKYLKGGLS